MLPSLYEGLGIVLIEAQANGLCSIASNFVPYEVNVTNTVDFVPLNKKLWTEKVLGMSLQRNSSDVNYELLSNAEYNIKKEAIRLLKIYQNILR
jgi:glycosyltransferase involved in cell wall biosynthesis